ncbi:rRNA maturation RNase YbeY [Roseospira marina]|uniref:Endoribonuclease YbeY n=1 Tax=Roseospira marina TaxID=140057 RepID=A0A5M6I9P2_9PROT|nr:rRNA maturation RNase YbeY [Roseospira marina]KAA5604961.1 rRNA maturation RNase YbeY [Roseospira marina]MBB4315040.1 putative rRNA maturation factor [Roseospira marina]MBB5088040.1 putative rRNA maturation factor [Roseospira marina]
MTSPIPVPDPAAVPDLDIDVVIESPPWRKAVKGPVALCERAARAALEGGLAGSPLAAMLATQPVVELCIALEDDASVHALNRDFRGQDKPTNVLSFAALEGEDGRVLPPVVDGDPLDPDPEPEMLGDVIVAFETTRDEAARDGKALADHLSHLVVHGVLHLLGYDHQDDDEAEAMEGLETRILAGLGIADPHAPDRDPGTGDDERRPDTE